VAQRSIPHPQKTIRKTRSHRVVLQRGREGSDRVKNTKRNRSSGGETGKTSRRRPPISRKRYREKQKRGHQPKVPQRGDGENLKKRPGGGTTSSATKGRPPRRHPKSSPSQGREKQNRGEGTSTGRKDYRIKRPQLVWNLAVKGQKGCLKGDRAFTGDPGGVACFRIGGSTS